MKTKKTATILLIITIIIGFKTIAQENKQVKINNFEIIIEKTNNGIKMQSVKGSAWNYLSFIINNNKPQAINEYGMTKENKLLDSNTENLANYLFTISKNKNGITLKGIKGTAWSELKFSFTKNKKQTINQFGMID